MEKKSFIFSSIFSNPNNFIRSELFSAVVFLQFFAIWFSKYDKVNFSYPLLHSFSFLVLVVFFLSFYENKIKKNLRNICNLIFVFIIVYCLYTGYQNSYNRGSFYAILLAYSFFSFLFASIKIY